MGLLLPIFRTYWLLAGLMLLIGFRAQAQQPAPSWDSVVPLGLRTDDDGIYVSHTVPDGKGNLYVAGYFFGHITIGSTTLVSTRSPTTGSFTGDAFVGKYNLSTGRYIWGLNAGSTGGDNATKLVVSGTSLYVAGTTTAPTSRTATITFGTTSYATTAHSCMFVAKLTDLGSSATWRWAKVGTNDYLGNVVGLGLNGTSVYLAGDLSGTMVWDTKRVSSNQTQALNAGDLLLVKITDAGASATVAWAQAIGSPTYEEADAFVMSGNNLYFSGNYFNTAGFGSISLPNTGTSTSRDAFLLKLTDNGTAAVPVWAQQFGGTGNDFVTALSLTGSTLYLAGAFGSPQLAVGTALTIPNSGGNALLVARLTDTGGTSSFDWATSVPVTGDISVEQLLQTDNKLFLAGSFTSEKAIFGSTTLTNSGSGYNNGDLYVLRLNETTPGGVTLAWTGQVGSSSQDFLYSLLLLDKRIGVLAYNREATTVGTTAVPARTSFLALANVDSPPATTTRQGNGNDWFNPANWDNGVPTRNTDAVVPSGMLAFMASGNAQARSLVVEAGANVLQLNGTLELTGNLVSQGSPNNGTYLNELLLTGASNQTIDNGQSLNLAKLTVGPAGATLNGTVTISSLLTLKGNLNTNSQTLRLVTTASATGANPALVDNAGGVVQGLVSVDRVITGGNQGLGYRHYAPPVTGATVASLTTTGFTPEVSQASVYNASATPGTTVPFPTVYAYDESRLATTTNNLNAFDKGFVVPAGLSAPLVPGHGYAVNIAGTEAVRFIGTLNNGDYPVALTRVAGPADAGWALVGNPYPAVLNWNLTTRTGLNDALYVVQSTGQYTGTYSGYVNGVAVNNGSPFVAPGQGFFVRVAEGRTTGSITFTNAARTTTAVPTNFQRLAQETRPLVRLALTGAGLTDEVVAYAEAGATPAFDPHFDAAKLPNPTGLNLSSMSAGESLAIDGRAAFTPATVLALSVGVPAAGTYSLSAAALANLPTGLTAYLHDAQTGQTTQLAAGISYPFEVAASEATALLAGRFTLRFSTATALTTVASLAAATVTVYPNPAHGNFTVLVPAVASATTVQGELLNTLGQVIRRQAAALPAAGATLLVETAGLAPGIYTLRLQAGASTLAKRVVLY